MSVIRKWLLFSVQLTVTALLLVIIFRDERFRNGLMQVLPSARPGWLAAALAAAVLVNLLSWVRWRICLHALGLAVPARRALGFYGIGLFASLSFLGPMGGDAVRVGLLWRDGHARATAAMSVLLDRTSGLVALVVGAVAFTALRHDWFQQDPLAARLVQALWAYLAVITLVLAGALAVSRRGSMSRLPAWVPGRPHLIEGAQAWNRFSRHSGLVLATIGLSMVTLMAYFFVFAFCAAAFGLGIRWLDIFAVMPIVDVAAALPVSFAGLGVRETLFELLLERLAGAPASAGVLVALGGFVSMSLWSLAGGLWLPGYRARKGGRPSLAELAETP